MKNKIVKKRTLDELRQVKTYGYRPPSPTRKQVSGNTKEEKYINQPNR